MKNLALILLLPVLAFGQAINVQKKANNDLTGPVAVPSGSSLSIASGGTLAVSGNITANGATLTPTELSYLDGVTSAIQSQVNAKAPLASPTFTGTVTLPTTVNGSGSITITPIASANLKLSAGPGSTTSAELVHPSGSAVIATQSEVVYGAPTDGAGDRATGRFGNPTGSAVFTSGIYTPGSATWKSRIATQGTTLDLLATTVSGTATSSSTSGGPSKLALTNAEGNINDLIDATNIDVAMQRGTLAEVETVVLPDGVPAWAENTFNLKIGDGSTVGGHFVLPPGMTYDFNLGDTLVEWGGYSVSYDLADFVVNAYTIAQFSVASFDVSASLAMSLYSDGGIEINSQGASGVILAANAGPLSVSGVGNVTISSTNELYASAGAFNIESEGGMRLTHPGGDPTLEGYGLKLGNDVAIYRSAADTLASNDTVRVFSVGGSSRTGGVWSESSAPRFGFYESDVSSGSRAWDAIAVSGLMRYRILADDGTLLSDWLNVARSGVATFPNTTASTSASTGAVVISGGLGTGGAIYAGGGYNGSVSVIGALQLNSTTQSVQGRLWYSGNELVLRGSSSNFKMASLEGTQTFSGEKTFSAPPKISGWSDASNADAGYVGEYVESKVAVGDALTATNATPLNVTSISLTAGDWDVEGAVTVKRTTATVTLPGNVAGISLTSATIPTDGTEVYTNNAGSLGNTNSSATMTLPRKRVNVSSTTTVYLVSNNTFSAGTTEVYGHINARRVR